MKFLPLLLANLRRKKIRTALTIGSFAVALFLFGLLGGVSTLGVLGLFIGPFMMAVLFWWLRSGKGDSVQDPPVPSETDKWAA